MNRVTFGIVLLVLCFGFGVPRAEAVPKLQLYIEGATYETDSESWVLRQSEFSEENTFRLWALGNTKQGHDVGSILDVRLSVAYEKSNSDLAVSLEPTYAGGDDNQYTGYNGITTLLPGSPSRDLVVFSSSGKWVDADGVVVDDGSVPMYGDRNSSDTDNDGVPDDLRPLPAHDDFGPETAWQQFSLFDFERATDPIGDFIDTFPTTFPALGQINVYEVSLANWNEGVVHFDLYDTYVSEKHVSARFAPFSHDAQVPESSSLALWSTVGAVFAVGYWFRRRRRLFFAEDRRRS